MLILLKISTLTILLLTTCNFIESLQIGVHPDPELLKAHSEEVLSRKSLRNKKYLEHVGGEVVPDNLHPQAEKYLPRTVGIEPLTKSEARSSPLVKVEKSRLTMPNTQTRAENRRNYWDTQKNRDEWSKEGIPFDAMDLMGEELTKTENGVSGTLLTQENREYWNRIRFRFGTIGERVRLKMVDWWVKHFKNRRCPINELEFKKERIGSDIPFWWDSEQMLEMVTKFPLDWMRMIEIGDLLAFNEKNPSFRIDPNQNNRIINGLIRVIEPDRAWQNYQPDPNTWLTRRADYKFKELFKDENHESLYETRISQILNVEVTRLEFKNILDNDILEDIEDYGWIPKVTRLEWLCAGLHPKSMSLYAASMVAGQSRTGVLPEYVYKAWIRWDPVTYTGSERSKGFAKAREYYSQLLGSEEFNKRLSNVIFQIGKLGQEDFWQGLGSLNFRLMLRSLSGIYNSKLMLATRYKLRRAT
ncbi:hypothetical protein CROQUDRAFT_89809 [Cronartium quercuum f. sp. fusiforme G11]|uniref:Uncharacterized protein n=1 Tax=Cronartium quercuum f. sp. fusiforme G11 TaxID=708437 RepID=A0A9P6TFH6_9BASI|nr:hypothetical protein CROQUDRAFT_89809 [Cronartium quercuum f. sp. fusiforme G11]